MKDVDILSAPLGTDVVSPDTDIPKGAVRSAINLAIHTSGNYDRRDGATKVLTLAAPRSLWHNRGKTLTLVVVGDTLYALRGTGAAMTATSVASGFWPGPVRFAEIGDRVYAMGGRFACLDANLNVTQPGVASMLGSEPVLDTAIGALTAGTYGVAIAAVSARGEESGLSGCAWIDLASDSGIKVTLPGIIGDAARYRIYRTTGNGDELYLADEVAASTSVTYLASGDVGRKETTWMRDVLPAGDEIAVWRGRLLSALGSFLFYSDPYNVGLYDPRTNFVALEGDCGHMVLPVDEGIYVGTEDRVYFLRGNSPKDLTIEVVAGNGVIRHSGLLVDGALTDGDPSSGDKPVAVWLSPHGYQIGRPNGIVESPQSRRIILEGSGRAPTAAFTRKGVPQLISATETLTLGNSGTADVTP